jgi:hypothetical protein
MGTDFPFCSHIRNILITRAANNAVAMSMPALASVLSFVIYSASGHPLDPGIIFASLSLFNLLRLPLMLLRECQALDPRSRGLWVLSDVTGHDS